MQLMFCTRTLIRFLKLCRCREGRICASGIYIPLFLSELGFLISPVTMKILFFKICAILRLLVKDKFVKGMAVL